MSFCSNLVSNVRDQGLHYQSQIRYKEDLGSDVADKVDNKASKGYFSVKFRWMLVKIPGKSLTFIGHKAENIAASLDIE